MLLADYQIKALAAETGMINPFSDGVRDFVTPCSLDGFTYPAPRQQGKIPWGLTSFGYDLRVHPVWKVFRPLPGIRIDPKDFDVRALVEVRSDTIEVPPNSYVLAESVEYFKIPDYVSAHIAGKSTYARCGICLNMTSAEPGWEGTLTIEISNLSPVPVLVYANEGLGQVHFFTGKRPTCTYADKKGRYQSQRGISLPTPG